MKTVIKRSGKTEPLTKKKIFDSIVKANNAIEEDKRVTKVQIQRITDTVFEACQEMEEPIPIDAIEDMIEKKLMGAEAYEVAKKYITYRYEKERVRSNHALTEKLTASNVVNQNANIDEFSFGGRIGESASYVMKEYALNNLISDKAKQNHMNNEVYIHDLDHYAVGDHNCLSIPFDHLLKDGFTTRQCDIRGAKSINTAMQLVAVIFQLQSLNQFGGVSATHLDWTMVPYVRMSFKKHYMDGLKYISKDPGSVTSLKVKVEALVPEDTSIEDGLYKQDERVYRYAMDKTTQELQQAVEGMYHNLNSLQSRSGCQVPFSSINYGTCTLPEGRMVIKALIEGSIKGIGKFHKTSIFPCGIFQVGKGINRKPGDPNYDLFRLALKSTSTRLYPNYANIDWSGNAGYDVNDPKTYFSTMGCRTANGADINADPGVNPQTKDGRGNICPVTIIMPTLAMEADRDVEKFMKLLDKKIHEAKDMLLERFDWICSQPAKSAKFMYDNGTMIGYKPEEGIRSALKHGTLVIGQLGLAETLQLLIGCDHTTEKGMELAKRIEQLFKDRCAQFKKEQHLNFGVYFTPAENLCYTAMTKFKEKYGEIPNVSDKKFFTNSMHVPVWHEMDPFEKIDIESQLTGYSNAGCITYVELDASVLNNIDALDELVNYAMDKDIPYLGLNLPSDTCLNCGFQGEIGTCCPQCGSGDIERLRRVTGYLTGNYTTAFNKGKQQEVEMRVKHTAVKIDC